MRVTVEIKQVLLDLEHHLSYLQVVLPIYVVPVNASDIERAQTLGLLLGEQNITKDIDLGRFYSGLVSLLCGSFRLSCWPEIDFSWDFFFGQRSRFISLNSSVNVNDLFILWIRSF